MKERTTVIVSGASRGTGTEMAITNKALTKVNEMFFFSRYHSPLGTYVLASSKEGLVCVKTKKQAKAYLARWEREQIELRQDDSHHSNLIDQLYTSNKFNQ